MSWFSILPAHLTVVETWIIRFFLLLGVLTIGPWVLFLLYDLLLYSLRTVHYEIPFVGGRAQGKRKPAPPTLEQRLDGRRRAFSLSFSGSEERGSPSPSGGPNGEAIGGGGKDRDGLRRVVRRREVDGGMEDADGGGGDEAVGD